MLPEDLTRLRHMLDSAQEAAGLIKGKTREDLDRDRLLNLALVRLLEIVGEAASRVTIPTRIPLVSKLQLGNPKMFDQAPLGLVGEAELRQKNTFPSWSLGTSSKPF